MIRNPKDEFKRLSLAILLIIVSCIFLKILFHNINPKGELIGLSRTFLKFGAAYLLTHIFWILTFGKFINMAELLKQATDLIGAVKFLGTCILRGLFYAGLMLAFSQMV